MCWRENTKAAFLLRRYNMICLEPRLTVSAPPVEYYSQSFPGRWSVTAAARKSLAEVAELADAHGSGPCTRKGVGVRVPSSAPSLGPSTLLGISPAGSRCAHAHNTAQVRVPSSAPSLGPSTLLGISPAGSRCAHAHNTAQVRVPSSAPSLGPSTLLGISPAGSRCAHAHNTAQVRVPSAANRCSLLRCCCKDTDCLRRFRGSLPTCCAVSDSRTALLPYRRINPPHQQLQGLGLHLCGVRNQRNQGRMDQVLLNTSSGSRRSRG